MSDLYNIAYGKYYTNNIMLKLSQDYAIITEPPVVWDCGTVGPLWYQSEFQPKLLMIWSEIWEPTADFQILMCTGYLIEWSMWITSLSETNFFHEI